MFIYVHFKVWTLVFTKDSQGIYLFAIQFVMAGNDLVNHEVVMTSEQSSKSHSVIHVVGYSWLNYSSLCVMFYYFKDCLHYYAALFVFLLRYI